MTESKIMTGEEFAQKIKRVAKEIKTLYVMGGIGSPINDKTINRLINSYSYNQKQDRKEMILNALNTSCFAFDCICFIKAILWGWSADENEEYGGTIYCSNGVDDITLEAMLAACNDVSDDFSNIKIGEYLYMNGHCGIYVGDGLAVECTPKWKNGVQITSIENICGKDDFPSRMWEKHGKLPYIDYNSTESSISTEVSAEKCNCKSCENNRLAINFITLLINFFKSIYHLILNQNNK